MIDPDNVPNITIGTKQFEINVGKEFPAESGKVGYHCQLANVNGSITYDNCSLTSSGFTRIEGETVEQASTRHAWVVDVKTNSGKKKGKFALIGGEWRPVS